MESSRRIVVDDQKNVTPPLDWVPPSPRPWTWRSTIWDRRWRRSEEPAVPWTHGHVESLDLYIAKAATVALPWSSAPHARHRVRSARAHEAARAKDGPGRLFADLDRQVSTGVHRRRGCR